MYQMYQKEACDRLQQAGFTPSEIDRLSRLRRDHIEKETAQALDNCRRLEFSRWLVKTGRLSDR